MTVNNDSRQRESKMQELDFNQGEFDASIFEIKDGLVNLTKMCEGTGKRMGDWLKNKSTERFLNAYLIRNENSHSRLNSNGEVGLKETKNGIGGDGATFGDRRIAIKLAEWISVDFEIWAVEQIDTLLQKGSVSLNLPSNEIEALERLLESKKQQEAERLEKEIAQADNKVLTTSNQHIISRDIDKMKISDSRTTINELKNDTGVTINYCVRTLFLKEKNYAMAHIKAQEAYRKTTGINYPGAKKSSLQQKNDYLKWLSNLLTI